MNTNTQDNRHDITLTGLSGSNPLGFLAAMGTFAECAHENPRATLRWSFEAGCWHPVLSFPEPVTQQELAEQLAAMLRLEESRALAADDSLKSTVDAADKAHMAARRAVRDAEADIKKRKLRGAERDAAVESEVAPLLETVARTRDAWLFHLKKSRPSPELGLGKDPAAQRAHFRTTAENIAKDSELRADRRSADLIAAFGSEVVFNEKTDRVRATSFCFVTGSGHQYFLQTAADLLNVVDEQQLKAALFESLRYTDEKLSLRWDPVEDRRYAMMWSDPTASDNKATTNWALNLLAYRGLQFFPVVPTGRRMSTTGFTIRNRTPEFTWPVWTVPVGTGTVRSLVASDDLQQTDTNRQVLAARGVAEVFRSTRLQVGNPPLHKLNFSPARSV
jgi:hypothetical protein